MRLNAPAHSFNIFLASEYGIEEAILIQHFQFWILKNKDLGRNFHEGRTWTYETLQEIAAHFPYLSPKKVERLILRLLELKIIRKGNFNKNKFDRTVWYSFENEEMFAISRYREMEIPISGNANPDIGKCNKDTDTISISNHISDISISARAREPCGNVDKSIPRDQDVSTTQEEHAKLVYDHGEEKTKKLYRRLAEWKMDTPKSQWKKNDYRSILRWVVNVLDKENKDKKPDNSYIEENERYAFKMVMNLPGRSDILLGTNYIEFINGPKCTHLEYSDKNFREQVEQELRKRGVDPRRFKD